MDSQSSVADFRCDENYHKRYVLEVHSCSDAAMKEYGFPSYLEFREKEEVGIISCMLTCVTRKFSIWKRITFLAFHFVKRTDLVLGRSLA